MSFWDNNNNNSHELQSQNQLPVVQSKGGSKMGSLAKKGLNNYGQTAPATPFENQGVLSAISDIVSQKLTGIQKLQLRRLLLKVVFGAAYLGPFGHFFHLILDKIFK